MKQKWKIYLLYSSVILFIGGFAYILVETIKAKNTGFETKTLWDWMELLIIPAVLAGGAILLNRSERALERKIADDRTKLERDLATDRQQEAALQTYFDRMSELLLKEKLRTTKILEVRDVARTRTLSILRGLDATRKSLLFRFLIEAKIIGIENPVIGINEFDLSSANLSGADLRGINLSYANLSKSDLLSANLSSANLSGANLSGADLRGINLSDANLSGADFSSANLSGANLSGADLRRADLNGADLSYARLISAKLKGFDLIDDLNNASLRDANLKGANFSGAIVTNIQLEEAKILEYLTYPDDIKDKW